MTAPPTVKTREPEVGIHSTTARPLDANQPGSADLSFRIVLGALLIAIALPLWWIALEVSEAVRQPGGFLGPTRSEAALVAASAMATSVAAFAVLVSRRHTLLFVGGWSGFLGVVVSLLGSEFGGSSVCCGIGGALGLFGLLLLYMDLRRSRPAP